MRRFQTAVLLTLAIFPLLAWNLALADATTPLVVSYGVAGCVAAALAIASVSSWLFATVLDER